MNLLFFTDRPSPDTDYEIWENQKLEARTYPTNLNIKFHQKFLIRLEQNKIRNDLQQFYSKRRDGSLHFLVVFWWMSVNATCGIQKQSILQFNENLPLIVVTDSWKQIMGMNSLEKWIQFYHIPNMGENLTSRKLIFDKFKLGFLISI